MDIWLRRTDPFFFTIFLTTNYYCKCGGNVKNNKAKFLAPGLVYGSLIGIVTETFLDGLTLSMDIVFDGNLCLIIDLAIGSALDSRQEA